MTKLNLSLFICTCLLSLILPVQAQPDETKPYHSDLPAAAARLSRDLKSVGAEKELPRHWFYDYRTSQKACLTDSEAFKQSLSPNSAEKPCWLDPTTNTWQTLAKKSK